MLGHRIPGILMVYPISKIVNFPDHSQKVHHRKQFDPLVQFKKSVPDMGHAQKTNDLLKQLLGQGQGPKPSLDKFGRPAPQKGVLHDILNALKNKQGPELKEGFKPVKEDLSWRGQPTK